MSENVIKMEASWLEKLMDEFQKPYIKKLSEFLSREKQNRAVIYPPTELIFHAFCHFGFDDTKVVIVGQDPYHNPNQAHGLCFSVVKGVDAPPSLQNIFKELKDDLNIDAPSHGSLESWAKQGILLLNATLTVQANNPKSHYGKGWEEFTDSVIEKLFKRKKPLVFILWGKSAQEKCEKILNKPSAHLILKAAHPSPFSAHNGFFGCRHFSKTNEFLKRNKIPAVDWKIKN